MIRGDSATGKTALVDMIREHYENGDASAIELTCDKECTVLEGRTWAGQLSLFDPLTMMTERKRNSSTGHGRNILRK